jgi:hypothetical protein
MNITIFGGDNIERINCSLCQRGFCIIKHISGRKSNHKCVQIPQNSDLVVVFIDYINHSLCGHIKKEAQKLGIKTIFSKRSWSSLQSLIS